MKYDLDTVLMLGFGGGVTLIVLVALAVTYRKRIRFSLRSLLLLVLCAGSLGLLLVELFPYNPAMSTVPFSQFPSPILSPDGRYLAYTQEWGANPSILDLKSNTKMASLTTKCQDFRFSEDGRKLLLYPRHDDCPILWDPFNAKSYSRPEWDRFTAISSGETRVLARVYDLERPAEVRLYSLDGNLLASHTFKNIFHVRQLLLSADANEAVIVTLEPRIYFWHLSSEGPPKACDLARRVHLSCISPDGSKVATLVAGGDISVWDTATGTVIRSWPHERRSPASMGFLDNDGRLFTNGDGVQIWDGTTGGLLAELSSHEIGSATVQWLAASQELAVLCSRRGIFYWKWSRYPHGISYFYLVGFWLSCATFLALLISVYLDRRKPKAALPQNSAQAAASTIPRLCGEQQRLNSSDNQ
ncbi:MAG: WD40 repeat domain-containing protein [Planctomycetota bacterium]|nr:WD40 repeat domain-containing protein [Planctomycetota bacterium]